VSGETDLRQMLRDLRPLLCARRYSFIVAPPRAPTPATHAVWARIEEDEGTTIIAAEEVIEGTTMDMGAWARITLGIHSSLAAVGLTAVVAGALAEAKIPANVVAGFYHDHIFVPWSRRDETMELLRALSQNT
jgi:hypothetical protein